MDPSFVSLNWEDNKEYSWRGEPAENFSDWTVRIRDEQGLHETEYPVHRLVLTVGDRYCEYFKAVFRGNYKESQEKCSSIEIPTADLFPVFLDWIYGLDSFALTNENAMDLLHLADYFSCKSLQKNVLDYTISAIVPHYEYNPKIAIQYLKRAHELSLAETVNRILPSVCHNMDKNAFFLEESSKASGALDTEFLLPVDLLDTILFCPSLGCYEKADFISYGVNHYQKHHNYQYRVCACLEENVTKVYSSVTATSGFVYQHWDKKAKWATLDRFLRWTKDSIMPFIGDQVAEHWLEDIIPNCKPKSQSDWEGLMDLSVRCFRAKCKKNGTQDELEKMMRDFVQNAKPRKSTGSSMAHMLSVAKSKALFDIQEAKRRVEEIEAMICKEEEDSDDNSEMGDTMSDEEDEALTDVQSEEDDSIEDFIVEDASDTETIL